MRILPLILFLFVIFSTLGQTPSASQFAPEWSKNATIYEVNIRQFTNEGTFRAFEEHLPRLKEMGVDIIWLMPIHPIGEKNRKGTLGSYYAVKDYTDVNPEFGKFEDFKNLVAKVHELDMKIIIDWVANHTSPDNVWVDQGHKDWYTLDSTGNLQPTLGTDWWDVADLNYDNLEMRKEMIESMRFWLKNADIDGFRCDVAGWVPMDFWLEAKAQLDDIKPIFFLAESEGVDQHQAFQMTYAWEFHHIMNKIAQKTENVQSVVAYFEREKSYPANAYRMNFTSNHDENSWNGTEMERLGKARLAMAVLSSTIMGMPLIYNGQETSLDRRLQFFEKDSIVWDKMDLVDFYTTLNDLHHRNQALWNGEYGGFPNIISPKNEQNVLAYVREKNGDKVLVIINLSSEERTFKIKNKSIKGNYSELFTKESLNLKTKLSGSIAPWSYKVYHITAN
jgi:glycosidase